MQPENWALVDIDVTAIITYEYIGILDKATVPRRRIRQHSQSGSTADVQAAWGEN